MQSYQVVKKLGTGTYGSAYVVTLKANPNQQYVLKKVKVEGGDVSADSEVKVLRALSHPLVLSYVDHFMYKGHLCIVTEYCDAGDLFQLLRARKAPLPEPQLLDLFAQVLLAIQHVHSKNILHRDLKTQNIFLTSNGSIRLGDFGISRPLNGTMDLASTIIGTPYYMSPEVMSSMPYDFKSDMWSLGCVLYEMMSLKHAFDATDMSSLVMKILRGEHLPIPQGYSQELKDLVRQLLCKNPKLRPSPDQMLKMPFLKEHVARARETVTALEQQRGLGPRLGAVSSRRTDYGQAPAPVPAQSGVSPGHRHSYSVGVGAESSSSALGGAAISPGQIDRELEAAKERLRRIQFERDALKQAAEPGPSEVRPVPAVPAGAGAGAALSGKSWRDKDEALQRLQQARRSQRELQLPSPPLPLQPPGSSGGGVGGGQYPPPSSSPYLPHLAGDVDAALERHREQRQLRSSRPQSPEVLTIGHSGGGGGGGAGGGSPPGGAGSLSLMDPKSRMKARKEEEARRREAELLTARKAYFEERKQAQQRLQQLYTPSPSNQIVSTARRATESSSGIGDYPQRYPSPLPLGHGCSLGRGGLDAALTRESSSADVPNGVGAGGPYGYYNSAVAPQRGYTSGLGVSDSDEEPGEVISGSVYGEGGALQEFEAELANVAGGIGGAAGAVLPASAGAAPVPQQLQQALDRGGLADRIMALREVCAYNLGQPLYELIYGYIRKRMAKGLTDDTAFRQELLQSLGPGRMQYVHLIDQLIYFEDMHGQSGLS